MNKVFTQNGWEDYVYWETEGKKTLKKINALIEDVCHQEDQHGKSNDCCSYSEKCKHS